MYKLLAMLITVTTLSGCSFWTRSPNRGGTMGDRGIGKDSSWFFVASLVLLASLLIYKMVLDRREASR